MERIVITHLSGSKANQEEKFPLGDFKEIILGRDPSSTVRFGEEPGTVVSRQHARITRNIALPSQFFISDLNSRNGTFVNQQRVVGTIGLKPGDVVQCGTGGPEFRFSIEPETDQLVGSLAPTADLFEPAKPDLSLAASSGAPIPPAGKTHIERLSAPAEKRSSKRLIVSGGVLIAVAALAAGVLSYRRIGSIGSSGIVKPVATPEASPSADITAAVETTPSPETTPLPEATPATVTAKPEIKASPIASRNAATVRNRNVAPSRRRITRPGGGKVTTTNAGKSAIKDIETGRVRKKGKEMTANDSDAVASGKKAKKAKKAKKVKIKP
ncbi:MAG: FHA domain-containing protein [Blastocatellales bacterium]